MGKSDGIRYSAHTTNYQTNVRCAGMSARYYRNHTIDKCFDRVGNNQKGRIEDER